MKNGDEPEEQTQKKTRGCVMCEKSLHCQRKQNACFKLILCVFFSSLRHEIEARKNSGGVVYLYVHICTWCHRHPIFVLLVSYSICVVPVKWNNFVAF